MMLKLTNIKKDYISGDTTVHALKGVSLEFRKSEFVSILGQSGCGKTTLLNIIGGLDKYTDGDLIINQKSTKEFKDRDWDTYRNHSVGFIFQSYNLIPHQSVLSNVELALTLSGVSAKERRARAKEALIKVGLGDQIGKKPNQMSGGQMQRVAIARALVNNPDILLADEPTGALDSETSVQIMELIKEISKDRLVIMVTHNPELAEQYSTRIINLLDGLVISDSNPYESEDVQRTEPISAEEPVIEPVLTEEPVIEPVVCECEECNGKKSKSKSKKAKKVKTRKPSMSFFTAFLLSLNNLLTKKSRTILTSFAGSIGIIGIALIFAVSNGTNGYIRHIQETTLSSYPLTVESESVDMSALIFTLLNSGNNESTPENRDPNSVYKDELIADLLKALGETKVSKNDLKEFKSFIDKQLENKDSTLYKALSEVQYVYDLEFSVYTEKDGKIIKSDTNELLQEMLFEYLLKTGAITDMGTGSTSSSGGGMMSSMFTMGSTNMWQEILADSKNGGPISDVIKDQYEFVDGGKWPTNANEIVLVLNKDNELDDLTLYALGLLDKEDIDNIIEVAVENTNKLNPDKVNTNTETNTETNTDTSKEEKEPSWTFDEIKARTYKVFLPASLYMISGNQVIDKSEDEATLLSTYNDSEKSIDLKITGIIRLKDGVDQGYMKGAIGYTNLLTKEVINKSKVEKNEDGSFTVLGLQMSKPNFDVFTGLPFKDATSNLTNAEKKDVFVTYMATLPSSEKAKLYVEICYLDALYEMVDNTLTEDTNDTISKIELETKLEEGKIKDKASSINYISKYLISQLGPTEKEILTEAVREIYNQTPSQDPNAPKTPFEMLPQTVVDQMLAQAVATQLKLSEMKDEDLSNYAMDLAPVVAKTNICSAVDAKIAEESPTTTLKLVALSELFGNLSNNEDVEKTNATIALYYNELMKFSSSTYKDNLIKLGSIETDIPSSINLFASTFEAKDDIKKVIDNYNSKYTLESGKQIKYSDLMGDMMKSITTIIDAITYVLVAFVATSLIVSSIMIGVITLISVQERTKEIGVLRAMGASKRDISRVFNAETLIVGFISGAIGIGVTIILSKIINIILKSLTDIEGLKASLGFWPAVILITISMLLTLIAGLIPSRVAAKKDPVIALRTE